MADYWSTRVSRPRVQTIPQMRTIPVGQSLEPRLEALPYEQVEELVQAHDRYAVAPCICRRQARLQGEGCDAPEECCLVFGEFADYYVRGGRARAIDRAEVMDLLARADAANLVLQPTNSKEIGAICCCCGCCCGILAGLQNQPKPAEAVASAFIARLDARDLRRVLDLPGTVPDAGPLRGGRSRRLERGPLHRLRAVRVHLPQRGVDAGAQARERTDQGPGHV